GADYVPDSWEKEAVRALPVSKPASGSGPSWRAAPEVAQGPAVDWWEDPAPGSIPPPISNGTIASSNAGGYGGNMAGNAHTDRSWNDRAAPRRGLVVPIPSPTLRLPRNIDDVVRKFVTFYCARFKLTLPTPMPFQNSVTHQPQHRGHYSHKKKAKQIQGDWHVILSVARHTTADGRDVPVVEGRGSGKMKKDAIPRAWDDLCNKLLDLSPQSLIDAFSTHATPFKRRLADMLTTPLRVDLSDPVLERLEDLHARLRERDPFKVDESFRSHNPPLLSGAYDGFAFYREMHTTVREADLRPPANLARGRDLPMYKYYADVMAAIENNPITILSAETGAGKTTQLPQFILAFEAEMRRKDPSRPRASVVVTQPRRIAAISVAQRVASERGEVLGKDSAIGYQVRFEDVRPKRPEDGQVVFCTSGILLKRLQENPHLNGVTHVILDEVHERDLEFYLEDVVDIAERTMRANFTIDTQRYLRTELYGGPPSRGGDDFPYDLFEAMIAYLTTSTGPGAILVFLPGWLEINTLTSRLKDADVFRIGFRDPNVCKIYPLHSSVPTQGQQEVFQRPPEGVRKIILSTNIAETSVTIDDIVYVIDSGKIRVNSYDSTSRISSLNSIWAAQSNIKQRCGRAGRCQPGNYYSMMSRRSRQSLPIAIPPELLRVDLQSTALKVKVLNIGANVGAVLSQAPEPPSSEAVYRALEELRSLGALDNDELLTPLGKILADLPVDPWIAKMVLQGAIYGCLDPILTVAAAMEIGRGIYSIHPDDKAAARLHILTRFAPGTESDQLTMLVAYRKWKEAGGMRDFAYSNYLHATSLANIDRAKNQLLRVLEDGGFLRRGNRGESSNLIPWRSGNPVATDLIGGLEANTHASDFGLVRAILCAALFPNVAEVAAKDEYRTPSENKLRMTNGSVNSWRGLCISSGIDTNGTPIDVGKPSTMRNSSPMRTSLSGRATPVDLSSDLLDIDNDDDDKEAENIGAPLPARVLAFQDKQRVDNLLYMRQTTKADPLALLLLASGAVDRRMVSRAVRDNPSLSLQWTKYEGRPAAMMAGWLMIQVTDEQRARVIEEVRGWLSKYLDWVVWTKAHHKGETDDAKDQDALGRSLIAEVASLLGDGSKPLSKSLQMAEPGTKVDMQTTPPMTSATAVDEAEMVEAVEPSDKQALHAKNTFSLARLLQQSKAGFFNTLTRRKAPAADADSSAKETVKTLPKRRSKLFHTFTLKRAAAVADQVVDSKTGVEAGVVADDTALNVAEAKHEVVELVGCKSGAMKASEVTLKAVRADVESPNTCDDADDMVTVAMQDAAGGVAQQASDVVEAVQKALTIAVEEASEDAALLEVVASSRATETITLKKRFSLMVMAQKKITAAATDAEVCVSPQAVADEVPEAGSPSKWRFNLFSKRQKKELCDEAADDAAELPTPDVAAEVNAAAAEVTNATTSAVSPVDSEAVIAVGDESKPAEDVPEVDAQLAIAPAAEPGLSPKSLRKRFSLLGRASLKEQLPSANAVATTVNAEIDAAVVEPEATAIPAVRGTAKQVVKAKSRLSIFGWGTVKAADSPVATDAIESVDVEQKDVDNSTPVDTSEPIETPAVASTAEPTVTTIVPTVESVVEPVVEAVTAVADSTAASVAAVKSSPVKRRLSLFGHARAAAVTAKDATAAEVAEIPATISRGAGNVVKARKSVLGFKWGGSHADVVSEDAAPAAEAVADERVDETESSTRTFTTKLDDGAVKSPIEGGGFLTKIIGSVRGRRKVFVSAEVQTEDVDVPVEEEMVAPKVSVPYLNLECLQRFDEEGDEAGACSCVTIRPLGGFHLSNSAGIFVAAGTPTPP
ncbi:hypothetical protein HK101_006289, partial [Irineochytrium annulatum]